MSLCSEAIFTGTVGPTSCNLRQYQVAKQQVALLPYRVGPVDRGAVVLEAVVANKNEGVTSDIYFPPRWRQLEGNLKD